MAEPRVPLKKRTGRKPGADPAPCGTYGGYNAHIRQGTVVCPECRTAFADYTAMRRFRSGHHHDIRRCRHCGSVFPTHTCHYQEAPWPD